MQLERGNPVSTATFDLIRQAMNERLIVAATYDGFVRHLCPHTLGYKNGKEKALLYQFAGGSKSGLGPEGSPQNWRCVFVSELSGVRLQNGDRHTAIGGHSRRQTCVDNIVLEVVA